MAMGYGPVLALWEMRHGWMLSVFLYCPCRGELVSEAVCTSKDCHAIELPPGEYWWCACGKQPMCDGSHKTTSFTPQKFTIARADTYYLCGCQKNRGSPFCDGAHRAIS